MAISKAKQLEQLELACKEQGVRLIYDDLRSEGGLCRLRDSYYVILNRRLAAETRCRVITDALARMRDMTETRPAVSDLVPVSADLVPSPSQEVMPETAAPEPVEAPAPLATSRPEFEYEEPEFGVPVSAGVPDSQG